MVKFKSVASEVIEALEIAERPLSALEIDTLTGSKYGSVCISHSLAHWVKNGTVLARPREPYKQRYEYSLSKWSN